MISFRPGWFYRTYWDNPKSFLDWLRRELPVIPGGGGGFITSLTTTGTSGAATVNSGVLNIPIYVNPGGTPGLDDVLAVGQSLTANRGINMGAFALTYTTPRFVYTNPQNITHEYHYNITTPTVERIFTASANNLMPFERKVDANANGGPPDDNIYLEGWNTDGVYDSTQPSWSTRLEYKYGGSLYEYHLQWSSPTGGRVYRLMSFTLQDHASSASDAVLEFHKNTGFEMRGLQNENAHWAVGNSLSGSVDTTTITTSSNSSATQVRYIVDGINNTVTEAAQAGNPTYLIDQFTSHQWRLKNALAHSFFMQDLNGFATFITKDSTASNGAIIATQNDANIYGAIYNYGTTTAPYGALTANTMGVYTNGPVGIVVMADNATGVIKFATGGNTEKGRLKSTGQWQFNLYGSNTFTGTVARSLGVDSSGNVIELVPFNNPLTTTGDMIYSSSGNTAARRAIGSTNAVLQVSGGVPTWGAILDNNTYTPTLTGNINVSSVSHVRSMYSRNGNVVTVTVAGNVTPTAGGSALTEFSISLPVNTATSSQGNDGVASIQEAAEVIAGVVYNGASTTVVRVRYYAVATPGLCGFSATFQYTIN